MKSVLFAVLTLLVCAPLFAVDVDPKLDRAVRDAMPVCGDVKVTYAEPPVKLPPRFTGVLVQAESARHACDGQYVAVLAPSGNFFLGNPWPIADEEGATVEEKLKNFTWRNMQTVVTATVDRSARTKDGLFRATLTQVTESGKLPITGEIDPDGKIFFFGHFRSPGEVRASRTKAFEPFLGASPALGASSAPVTIIEFSDFQCPSCQRSAGYIDPIVARHGEKVRYVRFDLPLSGHAWAFPAALAGRAIYRQKPEAFWEFKKQVYANQGELNAFVFWDWARGFAEDHDLDLAKYDADLANEEIKSAILNGAGTAFSNDIRATPSYMVNGALVDPGDDGKALLAYVDGLLK